MPEITIADLNLRGIHDRWWKREPLVVAGLAALRPDVICLQEAATWCLQARWLAWRICRETGLPLHVAQTRKRGWRGVSEGLATLSRFPIVGRSALGLGGEGRVAQRCTLRLGGGLVVANTHLAHRGSAGETRHRQAELIARWLEGRNLPVVLAGDLNDGPESAALLALGRRLRPAHAGRGLAGTSPAWSPGRVIDNILVSDGVEVLDAGTCLDRPVGGTWPSDHIGLWARLRF